MDELTRIQRSYAIPDSVLRKRVKQGNTDFLLPKYNEFYAKYVLYLWYCFCIIYRRIDWEIEYKWWRRMSAISRDGVRERREWCSL